MIKLINKIKNKAMKTKLDKIDNEPISTKMGDKFLPMLAKDFHEILQDEVIVEKTSLKDPFNGDPKGIKEMSYEDICDCIGRIYDLATIIAEVQKRFGDGAEIHRQNAYVNFQKAAQELKRQEFDDSAANDYFSAETIRDIVYEVKKDLSTINRPYEYPSTQEEAMTKLKGLIVDMPKLIDIMLQGCVIEAKLALHELRGFKK